MGLILCFWWLVGGNNNCTSTSVIHHFVSNINLTRKIQPEDAAALALGANHSIIALIQEEVEENLFETIIKRLAV